MEFSLINNFIFINLAKAFSKFDEVTLTVTAANVLFEKLAWYR